MNLQKCRLKIYVFSNSYFHVGPEVANLVQVAWRVMLMICKEKLYSRYEKSKWINFNAKTQSFSKYIMKFYISAFNHLTCILNQRRSSSQYTAEVFLLFLLSFMLVFSLSNKIDEKTKNYFTILENCRFLLLDTISKIFPEKNIGKGLILMWKVMLEKIFVCSRKWNAMSKEFILIEF